MESRIQLKEFRNLTNDWNQNPIPGIQIPRMSWISLHGGEVSFLVKTIIDIFSSDESQISREKKKINGIGTFYKPHLSNFPFILQTFIIPQQKENTWS